MGIAMSQLQSATKGRFLGDVRARCAVSANLAADLTMLRLNKAQRELLADKMGDAANLAGGAWLFGQILSDRGFSILLALAGVGVWLALVTLAAFLRSEGAWKGHS